MRKAEHVVLVAALCALPAAAPTAERHGHVVSNDGKGHWLHVLPERAEVIGPAGAWPADDGGTLPLMLDLYCREGEMPVRAILSFRRHPRELPAKRFADDPLRNLWGGLVSD